MNGARVASRPAAPRQGADPPQRSARERILDSAVELIARDGIDDARIARIAMGAGVSTSLVHYHFETRDALLAEALEHSYELAGDTRIQDPERRGLTHTASLASMIDGCLPYPGTLRRDWMLWVELWLRAARDGELRKTSARLYERMGEWFTEELEAGMAAGEFARCDPTPLADRILALIDGFGVRALAGDPAVPLERARQQVWSAIAAELALPQEMPPAAMMRRRDFGARRDPEAGAPGSHSGRRWEVAGSHAGGLSGEHRPPGLSRRPTATSSTSTTPSTSIRSWSRISRTCTEVRVVESYFDSMPGMMAKLQGGNAYDVVCPTAEFVQKLVLSDQLLQLPHDKLRHFGSIYAYFEDPWYDPGSLHSVPYSLYLTGIGYRSDLVEVTGSWNDLANPEAAGRIYVLDDFQEGIGAANIRNGYDLNTIVQSELDASRDWLLEIKPDLRGFSVDTITNMSSGNAWIQHMWNGDVINIRYRVDKPENYQFEKCSEGYPVGSDTFVIPVNAEHPGTALLFIDFMLDPKHAAQNCQWTGYPMPNRGADLAFEEIAKGDPAIVVTPEDLETGEQFANLDDEQRRLWDRTWLEVKAG